MIHVNGIAIPVDYFTLLVEPDGQVSQISKTESSIAFKIKIVKIIVIYRCKKIVVRLTNAEKHDVCIATAGNVENVRIELSRPPSVMEKLTILSQSK